MDPWSDFNSDENSSFTFKVINNTCLPLFLILPNGSSKPIHMWLVPTCVEKLVRLIFYQIGENLSEVPMPMLLI